MTLGEVAYQIDGRLAIELEGSVFVAELLDKMGEVAIVQFQGDEPKPECMASAVGSTPNEASENLVELLKGNILAHDWPIMWKTYTANLRIPPTLTV